MLKMNNSVIDNIKFINDNINSLIGYSTKESSFIQNAKCFGSYVGKPYGYNDIDSLVLPIHPSGFIRATLSGSQDFNVIISSIGNMFATLVGEGDTSLNINTAYNMTLTLSGDGIFNVLLKAIANLNATIDAGARPSAFDIAQEVLNSQANNYNSSGTIGNKINLASSGGIDYDALALAVWTYVIANVNTTDSAADVLKKVKKLASSILATNL